MVALCAACARPGRVPARAPARRTAGRRRAPGGGAGGGTCRAQKKTYGSFAEMLEGEPLMLVDFYATWCGPCLVMSNELSALSTGELKDRIKIAKIDTEKYPDLASQWQVQALPTLCLFKDGALIDRIEGAPNRQQLLGWLAPHLPPPATEAS